MQGADMLKRRLKKVTDGMPERERRLMELRFGLDGGGSRTIQEVCRESGSSPEEVRQAEATTLVTLHSMRHGGPGLPAGLRQAAGEGA